MLSVRTALCWPATSRLSHSFLQFSVLWSRPSAAPKYITESRFNRIDSGLLFCSISYRHRDFLSKPQTPRCHPKTDPWRTTESGSDPHGTHGSSGGQDWWVHHRLKILGKQRRHVPLLRSAPHRGLLGFNSLPSSLTQCQKDHACFILPTDCTKCGQILILHTQIQSSSGKTEFSPSD